MKWAVIVIMLLCTGSCKKMFLYSPAEVRLRESETNLNAKNIHKIQGLPGTDTTRFIVTGDSQRFYNELEDFVVSVNQRTGVAFVILNGDISDFGQVKEFKWVNDRLSKLKIPYIAVIGNHDMIANGKLIFNRMFGPDDFSFSLNKNKFICLNTNSMEVGNDGSLPDTAWLKQQVIDGDSNYNNAFIISHVPPFSAGFDQRLAAGYASILSNSVNARLSIHSHQHRYSLSEPYNDGMEYLVTGSMNKRSYVIITVINKNYFIERKFY